MGILSSKNRGVKYLLCLISVFIKYSWVKTLKNKKVKAVLTGFIGIVNESRHKPNKLWVDQEKEFCKNLIRKCLEDNDLLKNSIYNEPKSVVAERFVRNLKGKIYKQMAANDIILILVI